MRKVLYAFFSESSVPLTGCSFYTTTAGQRVRVSHLSKNMELTEWKGPRTDEYGRVISEEPVPLPADFVFVGEVFTDSYEFDPEGMSPDLSYNRGGL